MLYLYDHFGSRSFGEINLLESTDLNSKKYIVRALMRRKINLKIQMLFKMEILFNFEIMKEN